MIVREKSLNIKVSIFHLLIDSMSYKIFCFEKLKKKISVEKLKVEFFKKGCFNLKKKFKSKERFLKKINF